MSSILPDPLSVTTNEKHEEIGHLSKPSSESSNTEPDASGTDLHTIAQHTRPDYGSQLTPPFTMQL